VATPDSARITAATTMTGTFMSRKPTAPTTNAASDPIAPAQAAGDLPSW
jgi:hypothetical protein